jgi:hypothetical protein
VSWHGSIVQTALCISLRFVPQFFAPGKFHEGSSPSLLLGAPKKKKTVTILCSTERTSSRNARETNQQQQQQQQPKDIGSDKSSRILLPSNVAELSHYKLVINIYSCTARENFCIV